MLIIAKSYFNQTIPTTSSTKKSGGNDTRDSAIDRYLKLGITESYTTVPQMVNVWKPWIQCWVHPY